MVYGIQSMMSQHIWQVSTGWSMQVS